jgi:hypothetical protein
MWKPGDIELVQQPCSLTTAQVDRNEAVRLAQI